MDINNILQGFNCECGRRHTCNIKYIYIEKNAISKLPLIIDDDKKVLLIADGNTYSAAGEKTEEYISKQIKSRVIFPKERVLIPDENAVQVAKEALGECNFILGIGSGVIQDLCKYVSHETKIPYAIVATAPSMDGYASTGAAMIIKGMKVTYPCSVPVALIADTDVVKNAPIDMIKAGYGDIVGKYSALNDWKLSHLVNGEYLCPHVYKMTEDMLLKTLPLAKKLLMRDEESIKILTEALIAVGIAMSFAGSSRPASGSEHHLSHFFEITGIVHGAPYFAHGIDVLFSTYITSRVREKLLSVPFPDKKYIMPDKEKKTALCRVYGSAANGCMTLQNKLGSYERNLIPIYKENEEEIKKILLECPSSDTIKDLINGIGLDLEDFYKLYTKEKIDDAIIYAKDLKDRYTVLWSYYDMFGTQKV